MVKVDTKKVASKKAQKEEVLMNFQGSVEMRDAANLVAKELNISFKELMHGLLRQAIEQTLGPNHKSLKSS